MTHAPIDRMMFALLALTAIAVLLCAPSQAKASQDDYSKRSPFEAIRFSQNMILVQVDGAWYQLQRIDDADAHFLMEYCRDTYGELAEKRFTEDLVQVMTEAGHQPGETVELMVRELTARDPKILSNVKMTHENRQRIVQANRRGAVRSRRTDAVIKRAQAERDLDVLRDALESQYSYLTRTEFDYAGALEDLRDSLEESVNVADFAIDIQKFLAKFGDGHTRVNSSASYIDPGYLPFAVEWADNRVVAFDPKANEFLHPDAPYVTAIDGVEVDRWLQAAGSLVADGSEALQRSDAVGRLAHLNWLRRELGLPVSNSVTVQLAGRMHMGLETVTHPVSDTPVHTKNSPLTEFEVLDGSIMLLRIPSFSRRVAPGHVEACVDAMNRTGTMRGLIIDLRGNGGGSRRALSYLLPYFMAPDEQPVVVNAAKYRLDPSFEHDHLANRFLHRRDAPHWTDAEKAAIDAFAATFQPQWQPPAEKFSDWHYMVIRRDLHDDASYFNRPVVILMDRECFSATDIFLSAFDDRANVTLLGTPSSGGSGRAMTVRLPNSGIRLSLSSMASFRPDGTLYDGNGIEPDAIAEQTASDVIGRSDSLLQAAIRALTVQANKR